MRHLSHRFACGSPLLSPQFVSVASVTYPGVYQRLLDMIDVLNFDVGWILQTGCVVDVNFHHRLIASTVGPLFVLAVLGAAYFVARRRQLGSGSNTPRARTSLNEVNEKYLSLVLLLTFLVYSSVSSTLFQTFACDSLDNGKVYLRADYRIECDSLRHQRWQVYAGNMMVLYTIGIPALYATLLFRHRGALMDVNLRGEDTTVNSISNLWSLYKPHRFYYELVECLRRLLLAGVVVFIYPNTVAQVAIALMFAAFFMVLCEALAPYASVWDAWVSRLAHAIIFCSMYLALLLKVNLSGEHVASQKVYEALLVSAHVIMFVLAFVETVVVSGNWFTRR